MDNLVSITRIDNGDLYTAMTCPKLAKGRCGRQPQKAFDSGVQAPKPVATMLVITAQTYRF